MIGWKEQQYFSDWLQAKQAEIRDSAGPDYRKTALDLFCQYGLPHRKQDPWKYVDNTALMNLPVRQNSARPAEPDGPGQICFGNSELLGTPEIPGAVCRRLDPAELAADPAAWGLDRAALSEEENGYSLINAFSFTGAYVLEISESLPESLRISFRGEDGYQAVRLYIRLAAGCRAELLLDPSELGPGTYWNPYFQISLAESSELWFLESASAPSSDPGERFSSVAWRAELAESARWYSGLFYWNLRLGIHDIKLKLAGAESSASMKALCFGRGEDCYHLRSDIMHGGPGTRSDQLYKNILLDRAFTEFYGIIDAEPAAAGTEAHQQNRNLLLSRGARSVARPQLKIFTNDLTCTHGSSTGSLDEEELFYMRSRGLERERAVQLAITGFLEEVVIPFSEEAVRQLRLDQVCSELSEYSRPGGTG